MRTLVKGMVNVAFVEPQEISVFFVENHFVRMNFQIGVDVWVQKIV